MLLNLNIKNYVLIDELSLEFAEGLNIFTGETGAGKSIIIESIGLILGDRAGAGVVRNGSDKCFLSAEFDISGCKSLSQYLLESALGEKGEVALIIRREIDIQGKSRAFVNDKPVSISTLSAIGSFLVDVHGQNEHQALLATKAQRSLVDRFAESEILLLEVSKEHESWHALIAQKETRKISEQERERMADLYSFQLKEIDSAKLICGEEEDIEQKLPMLKNAEKLAELAGLAYDHLYGQEGSAIEKTGKVEKLLETIESLSGALSGSGETLKHASSLLDDALREIEKFKDNLNSDPAALNELLTRQDLLHKLKKKYGKDIPEILAYRDKIALELDALTNADKNLKELDAKIAKAEAALFAHCEKLSTQRKKASKRLSEGTQKELAELGMKKAGFSIKFDKAEQPTASGWDNIEFIFSANSGENLKPLKEIASGGEMSRVMLALKTVLAKSDEVPVLIFDEIDAGIGGPMGQTVGFKLKTLSKHHQVLCITHLPQIAAFAEKHFTVAKSSSKGQTSVEVKTLGREARLEEVARMLSGKEITPVARKHASELIEQSL
jgi:DNA repair protein RecN (Recombination protein N)